MSTSAREKEQTGEAGDVLLGDHRVGLQGDGDEPIAHDLKLAVDPEAAVRV